MDNIWTNKPENTFKPTAREQETFTTPKGLEVFSSLFKVFQAVSSVFKSFQVFSSLFKTFQVFSSLFKFFQVFLSLFKFLSIFKIFKVFLCKFLQVWQVLRYALMTSKYLKSLINGNFSLLFKFVQVWACLCKSIQHFANLFNLTILLTINIY